MLIAAYAVVAVTVVVRLVADLLGDDRPTAGAVWSSLAAALLYGVATLSLAHNGPRARVVAWVAVAGALVGVLAGGVASLVNPDVADGSVWSGFGAGYRYVPLVLPLLGFVYLARSRPGRGQRQ